MERIKRILFNKFQGFKLIIKYVSLIMLYIIAKKFQGL